MSYKARDASSTLKMDEASSRRRSNSANHEDELLQAELDELLNDGTKADAGPSWAQRPTAAAARRRTRARLCVNAIAFVAALFLGMSTITAVAHTRPSLLRLPPGSPMALSNSTLRLERILIRPQMNNEGVGSVLQRIKGSIMIAEHIANATFLLGEAQSEHGYSTSKLLNGVIFEHGSTPAHVLPIGKTCVLDHYLGPQERVGLILGVCAKDPASLARAEQLRQQMAPCTIILDTHADGELYESQNGCIRDFVRCRLGGIDSRRSTGLNGAKLDEGVLRVGVHVRWGDSAGDPATTETFRGSMDVSHMNMVLNHARETYKHLDIRVVMENHEQVLLDRITALGGTGNYELFDGDPMKDLKALADNDLLLVGGSSYGVLSHGLADPRGLSIVEGDDNPGKYRDSGREAVLMPQYRKDVLRSLKTRIRELEMA